MTVNLYVKIVDGNDTVRIVLADALVLRDWLIKTFPPSAYPAPKKNL